MSLPPEAYLWFKTLHIVGVVVWFAGLFYLVRLFIYHVETSELAPELQQPFRDQYTVMEKRLANIITTPGMVVAVSMATGLLVMQPSWLQQVNWSFIHRHGDFFRSQYRLAMMARNLDRMAPETLLEHQRQAGAFIDGLG